MHFLFTIIVLLVPLLLLPALLSQVYDWWVAHIELGISLHDCNNFCYEGDDFEVLIPFTCQSLPVLKSTLTFIKTDEWIHSWDIIFIFVIMSTAEGVCAVASHGNVELQWSLHFLSVWPCCKNLGYHGSQSALQCILHSHCHEAHCQPSKWNLLHFAPTYSHWSHLPSCLYETPKHTPIIQCQQLGFWWSFGLKTIKWSQSDLQCILNADVASFPIAGDSCAKFPANIMLMPPNGSSGSFIVLLIKHKFYTCYDMIILRQQLTFRSLKGKLQISFIYNFYIIKYSSTRLFRINCWSQIMSFSLFIQHCLFI